MSAVIGSKWSGGGALFAVCNCYHILCFSEPGKKVVSRILYILLPFLQFAPHIIQQFFVIDAIGD